MQSLKDRLAAISAERIMPDSYHQVLRKNVAFLRDSGMFDGALAVGERLPSFSLQNARGEWLDSDMALDFGPLVISFFRGDWCRFCRETLTALAEVDAAIRATGAMQVAISPDLIDSTKKTVEELKLPFEVLSDPGSEFGLRCGVVFRMPDDMAEVYRAVDLESRHGASTFFLPIPAVFVVDRGGIVRLSYTDPDYERRLEPQEILKTLSLI
jgi:peroxiredoxin